MTMAVRRAYWRLLRALRRSKKSLALDLYEYVVDYLRGPVRAKHRHEMRFWLQYRERDPSLSNEHFRYFYTTYFGLEESFFRGKNVLGIGCGPCGSLEWATGASKRVGLIPLRTPTASLERAGIR